MDDVLSRHRFSAREWQEMGRLGLFRDDARLELVDGEILEMSPIGFRHALCVGLLTQLLVRAVGDAAAVWVQNPLRLDDWSEPQPDVAVLVPPLERYTSLPRPSDVLVVIEVADTSVAYDRAKSKRYAAAGIPECWIVELVAERVAVLSVPGPDGYSVERTAARGATLPVGGLAGVFLGVDQVLGPR